MTICHKCKARTIQASLGPGRGFVYVDEQGSYEPEFILERWSRAGAAGGWNAYPAPSGQNIGYSAHVCPELVAS